MYLLTCADIAGTSPKLWNAWKDRLLADLYFAARRVLREGLENPIAVDARLAEARESVRVLLKLHAVDDATADSLFAAMPEESFLRFRPEQLAWQAEALRGVAPGETRVRARLIADDANAMEVFVHSPDRDGLFAAILATLIARVTRFIRRACWWGHKARSSILSRYCQPIVMPAAIPPISSAPWARRWPVHWTRCARRVAPCQGNCDISASLHASSLVAPRMAAAPC